MDGEQLTAEMAVIGGLLIDETARGKVIGSLTRDDFEEEKNREIFSAVCTLVEKGTEISLISVGEVLKSLKKLKFVGGYDYLDSCIQSLPFVNEITPYINTVRDKSLVRSFFETLKNIELEYEKKEVPDLSDFIGEAEKKILAITKKRRVSDFQKMDTIIGTVAAVLDERQKIRAELKGKRPAYLSGTTTGYVDLDKLIGGFQKGDYLILAARPSVGKTALALNFAAKAAHAGFPVGIFSLEMSSEQVALRLLSDRSHLSTYEIQQLPLQKVGDRSFDLTAAFSTEEQTKIQALNRAMMEVAKEPLYIDDSGYTRLIDIQAKARKLKNQEPELGLIIIDYLGLISSDGKGKKGDRQQEISEISRGIKMLAKELEVPILTLCQLSRNVESRQNHRPQLSDLRDSGAIEQDADKVFFIYRPDYYANEEQQKGSGNNDNYIPPEPPIEGEEGNPDSKNQVSEVKLILAKNRQGRIGDIDFVFLKQYCRFELSYKEDN